MPHAPNSTISSPYDAKEVKAEVNLASNEHPLNLPGEIITKLKSRLGDFKFNRYPDPTAHELRRMIAEANGLESENVLVGNGGDELIFDLLLAWGGPGRKILDMPPTFSMYGIDAQVTGTEVVRIPRLADFSIDEAAVLERASQGDIDIVVVANPNNPTGGLCNESFLIDLLKATDAIVMVDEAYFEFSRHTMRPHMSRYPNLVLLRTFSKAFSLAGLRVGYLLAHAGRRVRVHEGAPAVLGRCVLADGGDDGLPRAHGVREQHPRPHPRARPAAPRADDVRRRRGLSDRGELRAVPRRARAGALARPAPQPLGADPRLLAFAGTRRTACA